MVDTPSLKRDCSSLTWKNQFLSSLPKTCYAAATVLIPQCTVIIILVLLCMETLTRTTSVQHCIATITPSTQVHCRLVKFVYFSYKIMSLPVTHFDYQLSLPKSYFDRVTFHGKIFAHSVQRMPHLSFFF